MASRAYKIAFKLDAMLNKGFGKTFDQAEGIANRLGDTLGAVGKGMTVGVTMPLLAVGAASVKAGAELQSSMNEIHSRTRMAAVEVEYLENSFRAMAVSGNYGAFTAREVAAAYSEVAIKGQDAEHATTLMRSSMVLGTAVGKDLGRTAYFLGNYLLKVGKDASYAERYINVFAATNQMTQMSLDTLQKYLFRANVTLQATNISGTEASAMFGRLYQAGVRGAAAYSGVENALRSLLVPTQAQIDALDSLYIARVDEYGQLRDGIPFLMDIAKALNDLEGAQFSYYAQLLGSTAAGMEFLGGMVDIKDTLPGTITELNEAANAAYGTGTAFEMAAKMQSGLAGDAAMLRVRLEEIKLQISDALLPTAMQLVDGVGNLIYHFATLDEGTRNNIIRFGMLAAAAGPVLLIISKLIKAGIAAKNTYIKVSTAIKGFAAASKLSTAAAVASEKATRAQATATMMSEKAERANAAAVKKNKIAGNLAMKAEILRTKKGATHAAIIAAQTKAENARAIATKVSANATQLAYIAEKKRTIATNASIAAQAAQAKVTKAVTAALKIKTIAQKALNAAKMMNPIGLIIAGVVALTAAVIALVRWINRTGAEYQALGEEADRLRERQEALVQSSADAAETFTHELRILQARIRQYDELADCIEHATKIYSLHRNEISRVSYEYTELGLGLEDTLRKISSIEEQLSDGSNRRRRDTRALEDALENLRGTEAAYLAAMEANRQMQTDLALGIRVHADVLADMERAQEDAAAAMAAATAEMEEQVRQVEKWEQAQSDAIDKMTSTFENYKNMATNMFRTVEREAAISAQQLTQNLLENARMVEEWSVNLQNLAQRGLDEGLIEQLRSAGPEAAATVAALVDACDYELAALNEAFDYGTRVAVESMCRALDPHEVTSSATELIDHVAETILNNKGMEDAMIENVQAAFRAFTTAAHQANWASVGSSIANQAASGMRWSGVTANVNRHLDGSHADGLPYVPFDGYIAQLHRGERVLTAEENTSYTFAPQLLARLAARAEPDDDGHAPRPIDYIQRMLVNGTTTNNNGVYHYHAAPITIEGSGLSESELREILDEHRQDEQARFESYFEGMALQAARLEN